MCIYIYISIDVPDMWESESCLAAFDDDDDDDDNDDKDEDDIVDATISSKAYRSHGPQR